MTDTLPTEPTPPPPTDVSYFHQQLIDWESAVAEFGKDVPEMTERISAFVARVHDEVDAMATKIDRKVNP